MICEPPQAMPRAVQTVIKPRRVCAAHGANRVKIIFSGGKWVRLQERKARLVKSNPCSAYVGKNTSRPASWVRLQTRKRSAARLVKSNPCSAVEFSRQRRENYARSRVQAPSNASPAKRVVFESVSKTFLTRSRFTPPRLQLRLAGGGGVCYSSRKNAMVR